MVVDRNGALTQHLQRRVQQQIKCTVNGALGRVFDRNNADLGLPGFNTTEDFVERATGDLRNKMTELLKCRLFRKRPLGPQVRHREYLLQPPAGRNNFSPDGLDRARRKRPVVKLLKTA